MKLLLKRPMDSAIALRRISVQDYHRIAEAGIFRPEERVELLEGQLIKMAAKGTAHSAAVSRVEGLLRTQLGSQALLRLQDPIRLNDYSEPEPDIAIVAPDPGYYENHHPIPSEVFWLIEVSDTTLKYDREVKAPSYARSGIVEYWILDVNQRVLHVYRSPSQNGYQSEIALAEESQIAPLAFPDCVISVGQMLRSLQ
ncbi:Uma2 family endonuclease [Phormidesmis sp. 146-33]